MKTIFLHINNFFQLQLNWQALVVSSLIYAKRNTLLLVNALFFLIPTLTYGQGPAREYDKYIQGMLTGQNEIVVQAPNGDVVIGRRNFFNGLKLTRSGNNGLVKLDKTYNGGDYFITNTILLTSDNGYLLGATIKNAEGNFYQVIRLSSNGNLLWKKKYGIPGYANYQPVIQTTDGGFIIGSYTDFGKGGDKSEELKDPCPDPNDCGTNTDYWIVKLDGNGNKLWDKSFGAMAEDNLRAIIPTADGGCLLAGNSFSEKSANKTSPNLGMDDIWLVKVSSNGSKQWEKSLGGNDEESPIGVVQLSDQSFLVRGRSISGTHAEKTVPNNGDADWLVKVSKDGKYLWDKFPAWASMTDQKELMIASKDGGFLVGLSTNAGTGGLKSEPGQGGLDYWMVKFDSKATRQWDKRFGGTASDKLFSLLQLKDASFQLFGYSLSGANGDKTVATTKGWLVKTYPPAPTNLTALPKATNQIELKWKDNLVNENAYVVERATVTGGVVGSFSQIAALAGNIATYTDQNLPTNISYAYRIKGLRVSLWQGVLGGSSDYSITVIAKLTDEAVRITDFFPKTGSIGTQITIKGYGFIEGGSFYVKDVKVNTTAASPYVVESENTIKAKVAVGTGLGKISLIAQNGSLIESDSIFTVTMNIAATSEPLKARAVRISYESEGNTGYESVSIYPNPVQETLSFSIPGQGKEVDVAIYDRTGKSCKSFRIMADGGVNQVDVSNLPAGMYFLSIPTGSTSKRVKWVKM